MLGRAGQAFKKMVTMGSISIFSWEEKGIDRSGHNVNQLVDAAD